MAAQQKDLSRVTETPAELAGADGKILKFAPINPVKVCGALGRHVKNERQNSFMSLAERNSKITDSIISSTLAKIEAQPYTMQMMMEEMQTYEGTKFVVWQSLLKHQPNITLEQIDNKVSDIVAALQTVLGLSGLTTDKGDDAENPTVPNGQTLPTGVS